jgi:hypothetical protein
LVTFFIRSSSPRSLVVPTALPSVEIGKPRLGDVRMAMVESAHDPTLDGR